MYNMDKHFILVCEEKVSLDYNKVSQRKDSMAETILYFCLLAFALEHLLLNSVESNVAGVNA